MDDPLLTGLFIYYIASLLLMGLATGWDDNPLILIACPLWPVVIIGMGIYLLFRKDTGPTVAPRPGVWKGPSRSTPSGYLGHIVSPRAPRR